jgi:LacI family transcriptional regulator
MYAKIRVPEEIAVLGGEHDELTGAMSTPPLSTIDWPAETVGYEAAKLLDRMIAGEDPPEEPALIKPRGIITRQSTNIMAIENELLSQAIGFIREHACEGIQVNDVLSHVPISRRVLEQQCLELLGRSPAAEIRRTKLDRAVKLLIQTEWAIPKIALACGFADPNNLARVFRREKGKTPSEFRRLHAKPPNIT